jgi:hypothetical protein
MAAEPTRSRKGVRTLVDMKLVAKLRHHTLCLPRACSDSAICSAFAGVDGNELAIDVVMLRHEVVLLRREMA